MKETPLNGEWNKDSPLEPRKKAIGTQGKLGHIRIVFEKGQKFWEYIEAGQKLTETKQGAKLSKLGKDWFERCEIKQRMLSGPCKDQCSVEDKDCRFCSVYLGLNRFVPVGGD